MINIELLKTISAFGGLLLGLVNLCLLLYKDFFRRARLNAKTRLAEIRGVEAGVFDIQIDFELSSVGGTIYLKAIQLTHSIPVFDPVKEVATTNFIKAIDSPGYCLLNSSVDEFEEKLKALFMSSKNIVNLNLSDKEHRLISIIDRIFIKRYMDGFWSWPKNGWCIKIEHSEGETVVPLAFTVNKSSKFYDFCH